MAKKGSQFERDISRALSKWWTDGERDDIFWRTSGSGARATARTKVGKKTANSYGDIMALDPIGEPLTDLFVIELKRGYNKTSIIELIDSKNKNINLVSFWKQVERDRKESGRRYSLLIFKRDRKSECAMVDWATFCHLENYCGRYNGKLIMYSDHDYSWAIISFKDFMDWVSPDSVKIMLRSKPQF